MDNGPFLNDLAEKTFMAMLLGGSRIVIAPDEHGVSGSVWIERWDSTTTGAISLNSQFPRIRELAIELHMEMMKEYFKYGEQNG